MKDISRIHTYIYIKERKKKTVVPVQYYENYKEG
jgi:hypothetical protein